jgi:hypothetical protein
MPAMAWNSTNKLSSQTIEVGVLPERRKPLRFCFGLEKATDRSAGISLGSQTACTRRAQMCCRRLAEGMFET